MISKFPHINKINDVILILRQYFLSLKFSYKKEMRKYKNKNQKQKAKQVNVNEKAMVNVCCCYVRYVHIIRICM